MLNAIEPDAVVYSHPDDLNALGMKDGDLVKISSRRGEIIAPCRSDNGLQPKSIFIPFCYQEAAANLLTNAALDRLEK